MSRTEASLWKNRTFLFVFTSNNISLLGNTFHSIALNLWILQSSGSAKLMSSVLIIHLVLSMLFSSIAGTVADRVDRRKLMWVTDILRFIAVATIAWLIYLETNAYAVIIFLSAITALIGSFRSPAFQASLHEIVEPPQITYAVGAMSIADNLIRISGFALGGVTVALLGGAVAIAIDAIAFLSSAIFILFARSFPYKISRSSEQKKSFFDDFKQGFQFAVKHPTAQMGLMILPLIMFFFLSTFMLIQVLAVQIWQASGIVFGLIEACIPLGYVIGSSIIMTLDRRISNKPFWIYTSIMLMGPLCIIVAFLTNPYAALPLILAIGFLFSFSTTIIFIMLRKNIEGQYQGRVFGMLSTATSAAPPIGLAIFASLSDWIGPVPIIAGSGSILFLIGLGILLLGNINLEQKSNEEMKS